MIQLLQMKASGARMLAFHNVKDRGRSGWLRRKTSSTMGPSPKVSTVIEVIYSTISFHAGKGRRNRTPTSHMIRTATHGAFALFKSVSDFGPAFISPTA